MRAIESLDSIKLDELLERLGDMGNKLLLVRASGEKILLHGGGRIVKKYTEPPEKLRNVEIVELDKFEFLDHLQEDESRDTPTVVEFSYSLEAPSDVYLRLEEALLKAVSRAYKTLGVAVGQAELKASVRYGATGRDILLVRGNVEAFSTGEVEKTNLARVLSEAISRETGFDTRVVIRELSLTRTPGKPVLKVPVARTHVRGGRVLEVPLGGKDTAAINREKVEAEVERILREAGIGELAGKLKEGGGKGVSARALEAFLLERLSGTEEVKVNWVRVSPAGNGEFKVAIGASRRSKSRSDVEIAEMTGKSIVAAEREGRARGLAFKVFSAFLVLEEDIY
ncbi:hypothetical protein [Thermococcus camini]|uniref:Uncharacterized protein n=1 Tax=Thermococcus camini TaxID=2016373 RepID=A0A7G2D6P0_9EURY|nr:hypothetical protein [Thermococcus camini]CAD5244080.1 conserved protein of unknown function [Thermococcus camini]